MLLQLNCVDFQLSALLRLKIFCCRLVIFIHLFFSKFDFCLFILLYCKVITDEWFFRFWLVFDSPQNYLSQWRFLFQVDHPKCGRRLLLMIGFLGMLITSVLLVISLSLYVSEFNNNLLLNLTWIGIWPFLIILCHIITNLFFFFFFWWFNFFQLLRRLRIAKYTALRHMHPWSLYFFLLFLLLLDLVRFIN